MEVKKFLGFTDGIKEPRKTKVENQLNKLYRYNGKIYNAVTFLCVKLLEGCYPEKQENCQSYKRDGGLTKPKTIYMYKNPKDSTFFELNKTQYDFVCYLLKNSLNTEESMMAYDRADIERIEAQERAEREEKARLKAEEQKQAEERERMKNIIAEEAQHISPQEKEIVDSIFLNIYDMECTNYFLIPLIHNFDNSYCKEEIIARLHNDNKASIKIFECLTGLKLPKSHKERIKYLKGITSADFKGVTEYKPRKKREKKEVQKEEFYINKHTPGGLVWEKVFAVPITKYGAEMFIFCNNGSWILSLAESGLCVARGRTKSECMENLKKFVDSMGKDEFVKLVKDKTEYVINKIGANPRYKAA